MAGQLVHVLGLVHGLGRGSGVREWMGVECEVREWLEVVNGGRCDPHTIGPCPYPCLSSHPSFYPLGSSLKCCTQASYPSQSSPSQSFPYPHACPYPNSPLHAPPLPLCTPMWAHPCMWGAHTCMAAAAWRRSKKVISLRLGRL